MPTKYLEKFRSFQNFDYNDIAATIKECRGVGIAFIAMKNPL
jgi:hypothetical protein